MGFSRAGTTRELARLTVLLEEVGRRKLRVRASDPPCDKLQEYCCPQKLRRPQNFVHITPHRILLILHSVGVFGSHRRPRYANSATDMKPKKTVERTWVAMMSGRIVG